MKKQIPLTNTEIIEVRLEVSSEQFDEEAAQAEETGFRLQPPQPVEPPLDSELDDARFVETVAVVATVTIAGLAKRIVDHWLKGREEGVQIDARTTPPTVSRIANVPRGFVVLIDKDGKVTQQKPEYAKQEGLEPLLRLALRR